MQFKRCGIKEIRLMMAITVTRFFPLLNRQAQYIRKIVCGNTVDPVPREGIGQPSCTGHDLKALSVFYPVSQDSGPVLIDNRPHSMMYALAASVDKGVIIIIVQQLQPYLFPTQPAAHSIR
jgi:hypothetical protein